MSIRYHSRFASPHSPKHSHGNSAKRCVLLFNGVCGSLMDSSRHAEPLSDSRPRTVVGPGKFVRLAVIDEAGRRSTTWNVWTSRHTLDAYITARPQGGRWKVSLHASGSWQHGFTVETATLTARLPSRHLDIWQRPDEFAPAMRRGYKCGHPVGGRLRDAWPNESTKVHAHGSRC